MKIKLKIISIFLFAILFVSCKKTEQTHKIRVGYFPNLAHAQALLGLARGDFQKKLGTDVQIETKIFNAGPSAVEALFAEAIDLAYIGPSPAVNAYIKSGGQFQIIAGAASGGSALVVRKDSKINNLKDFQNKKIATPQLGNTQDVTARYWLKKNQLVLKEKGGTVELLPTQNADQISLFLKNELDAAWTTEPWISRLIFETQAKVWMQESELWQPLTQGQYSTAVILVNNKFLKQHPEWIEKWLEAHVDVTEWIAANSEEAKKILNQELSKIIGKPIPDPVMNQAFKNLCWTYNPITASIQQQTQWAFEEGFLGKTLPELSHLVDLTCLNEILKKKNYPPFNNLWKIK